MTAIDNPYDGEAARIVREKGVSEQLARDYVVRRHLQCGDTRALAFWLERSYCPGEPVRRLLAYMLQPVREDAENPNKTYTCSPHLVPFELVPKGRGKRKGRRTDPVAEERNTAIREMYDQLYAEVGHGGSDSVIAKMVETLEISESMIREAIRERSPKSSRGKK